VDSVVCRIALSAEQFGISLIKPLAIELIWPIRIRKKSKMIMILGPPKHAKMGWIFLFFPLADSTDLVFELRLFGLTHLNDILLDFHLPHTAPFFGRFLFGKYQYLANRNPLE
jgi:hypothetical protein